MSNQTQAEPSTPVRPHIADPKNNIEVEAGPSQLRRSSSDRPHPRPSPPKRGVSPPESFLSRPSTPHLDLTTYPTPTLLRLLASLLHQIATANDQLRPELEENWEDRPLDEGPPASRSSSRQSSHPHPSPTTALFNSDMHPSPSPLDIIEPERPLFTASRQSLSHPSSLLSFHARHVPSISIEAYLLRILKYCPTTNEVFLGLLVYFDRMSRLGTAQGVGGLATGVRGGLGGGFAIDSYNVHRLVIAGVTVASKFFSGTRSASSQHMLRADQGTTQTSSTQTRATQKSAVFHHTN